MSIKRILLLSAVPILLVVGAAWLWFGVFSPDVDSKERVATGLPASDTAVDSLLQVFLIPQYQRGAFFEDTVLALVASEDSAQAIAPLLDLMRFVGPNEQLVVIAALQDITGQQLSGWGQWLDYVTDAGAQELSPGYFVWKGQFLAQVLDPDFELFFTADTKFADDFRPELAVWGGVSVASQPGVDKGIPPLEEPATVRGSAADYLRATDTIYGVVIDGVARAYPQRIVDWHEMINDVIAGKHLSIAYCTLCGAAVAYDTELSDGTFRTFSSSGLLYQSNKVMFDRQTNTLWNHLRGTPVAGPLVGEVDALPVLPIETTTWEDWLERYPDTEVLDIVQTGFSRDYSEGVPSYNRYYDSPDTLFPVGAVPGPLVAKDRGFGIVDGSTARVYERNDVWAAGVINDMFINTPVVVVTGGENQSIRAYERGEYTFTAITDDTLTDDTGQIWEVTDKALVFGEERLLRLSGHEAFWFGWALNYPDVTVYGRQ